jgi:superoxide dismutase, Cu-Zn family
MTLIAANERGFMQARFKKFLATATLSLCGAAQADITVQMNSVDENGVGKSVGQVVVSQTPYGVVFNPSLAGLPPGLHGFHVHENPSCVPKEKDGKMVAALAAGGHYDPIASKRHGLPWGDGHLGDLPALYVDDMGNANYPVLAPRLKIPDVEGRSLMVHAGGDNHADHPAPLGGGGARLVCGVIQ